MDLTTIDTADLIAELATRFPHPGHPRAVHDLDGLLQIVAEVHGIHAGDIITRNRTARVSSARFQFIAIARKRLKSLALTDLGQFLDARDHTTIIHATKTHQELLTFDTDYKTLWINVVKRLN